MWRISCRRLSSLRVAVLFGGISAERTVSLQSGAAVTRALQRRGHDVICLDPAEVDLAAYDFSGVDAAFIALHGEFGEDGQVQQLLEDAGVRYTGSGVEASRLAFSKSATKERLAQHGIATPASALVHVADEAEDIERKARLIGYPLVVKPDRQGSSLGVSIVRCPDELPVALTSCFQYGPFGLLETYIEGSEWTVGLLDEMMLPVIRIETDRGFFDFAAKYEDEATGYCFVAEVPQTTMQRVQLSARRAAEAVGTRGLARVDLMLDRHDQPWVLEINTVPGLTGHSLVPRAAARIGLEFPDLCERALQSCLRRSRLAKAG